MCRVLCVACVVRPATHVGGLLDPVFSVGGRHERGEDEIVELLNFFQRATELIARLHIPPPKMSREKLSCCVCVCVVRTVALPPAAEATWGVARPPVACVSLAPESRSAPLNAVLGFLSAASLASNALCVVSCVSLDSRCVSGMCGMSPACEGPSGARQRRRWHLRCGRRARLRQRTARAHRCARHWRS